MPSTLTEADHHATTVLTQRIPEGRLLESYSMVETLQQHAYDAEMKSEASWAELPDPLPRFSEDEDEDEASASPTEAHA